MKSKRIETRVLTGVAIFTAIVVVLQMLASMLARFGFFSISLVLIPIVVGAAMYGPGAGAWLGFAFGLTVLLSGDAAVFMPINPLGAILTVLVKGTLAGFCAGLIYKAIEKKNIYVAVVTSAVACPVINTGVFLLGCRLFFFDTISQWAAQSNVENVWLYMIVGLIGINFVFELAVNIVLSPIVVRLINIGKKGKAV